MKDNEVTTTIKINQLDYLLDKSGILSIRGELYDSVPDDIERSVLAMLELGNKNITIQISSEGGDVFPGLAIVRVMNKFQKQGVKFTGVVEGYAMSMAFIILQCCDIRIMGKYDVLMCHGASGLTIGDKKNLEAETKLMNKFQNDFSEMIAKRNTAEEPEYHEQSFWANILDENTPQYYDAQESLNMGIIDKIED
jgi:ATP-dependent protease ClpP protease subunit